LRECGFRKRDGKHRGEQRGRGTETRDQGAAADGGRFRRAVMGLEQTLAAELLEAETNDVGVILDSQPLRKLDGDRFDRA